MIDSATIGMLFKGAGPGTHWHSTDPRISGFLPPSALVVTTNAVITHITAYSFPSPFLSLSASFAIARGYALLGPAGPATKVSPGYVYEIDMSSISSSIPLVDPVEDIASRGTGLSHSHNGAYALLAEVAQLSPALSYSPAHQSTGVPGAVSVSQRLLALTRAIRDAEVLAHGGIPPGAIFRRHDVY